MQNYLKKILLNPPHSLGRIANFLLIASAILIASIFFVDNEQKDITLSLIPGESIVKQVPGAVQKAKTAFVKLYPLIKAGQEISKGDTLFSSLSENERKILATWRAQLKTQKLAPTAEMLQEPMVTANIREKMIALAKVQAEDKSFRSNGTIQIDTPRQKELKRSLADFKKQMIDLQKAIATFEKMELKSEKMYFSLRDRYELKEINLQELKKAHKKWEDNKGYTKLRKKELRTDSLKLFDYQSELAYLNKSIKKKMAKPKAKTGDLLAFEMDLGLSLDSISNKSYILSSYSGQIASIKRLDQVAMNDNLLVFEGKTELSNRKNTFFAESISNNAKDLYPGGDLLILLQDGYKVDGKITAVRGMSSSDNQQYEIVSSEVLVEQDIAQIVLPAKNVNFIEKVMKNF